MSLPTANDLRAVLRHEGKEAGCVRKDGRCLVRYGGRAGLLLLRYRIIWTIERGEWPDGELDHINGNPSDDRLENLRVATSTQNKANRGRRRDNVTGVKGALPHRSGRFSAQIAVDGKSIHLGMFDTVGEAGEAYMAAARVAYGEFARGA